MSFSSLFSSLALSSVLLLTGCVSLSYGGEIGAGISHRGRPRFEARGAGGPEFRRLDAVSTEQSALVTRAFLPGAHLSYEPSSRFGGGSAFGGGVDLEPVGLTQFWGAVGFAGNLLVGFDFDHAFRSGWNVLDFFVRLQLGVEIETTPSDWSIIQGPFSPCARRSHHEILSLLPSVEYRGGSSHPPDGVWFTDKDTAYRDELVFSFWAGYRALNEVCSDGGA